MAKRPSTTPAIRVLRDAGVAHRVHEYDYVERGGTRASSASLGVDEHAVIKTLVFEDDRRRPFLVLMHGDREVSARALARHLGVKRVSPCAVEVARRHSGYQVGGTSPFATAKRLPVYMEETIADLERIYINAGRRGLLVELAPADLERLLSPTRVAVAQA